MLVRKAEMSPAYITAAVATTLSLSCERPRLAMVKSSGLLIFFLCSAILRNTWASRLSVAVESRKVADFARLASAQYFGTELEGGSPAALSDPCLQEYLKVGLARGVVVVLRDYSTKTAPLFTPYIMGG